MPCNGVIFYNWNGRDSYMEVGLTQHRDGGYGLTFGGKINTGAVLDMSIGEIASMVHHLYEEGTQELDARMLNDAIPYNTFRKYVQLIDVSLIRVEDGKDPDILTHASAYYAYPVTMHERLQLANLPDTAERIGQILWAELRWRGNLNSAAERATNITLNEAGHAISWSVFKHRHEQECVLQTMALLASQKRLWNDRATKR